MKTESRKLLIKRMAAALYSYSTECSSATWNDKRRGLRFPTTNGVAWKSCGGFRAWTIHAYDGRVAFSMDGYRHRNDEFTGYVMVLIGDGQIMFPIDDSRSSHCMHLTTSQGSKLLSVCDDPEINWEPHIESMACRLEAAHECLRRFIAEYDAAELEKNKRLADADRASAIAAIGN